MQNQAYRCQVTAKGYYQTSDVDYYMAHDMPLPPVAPVLKADLYYANNGSWIDNNDNNVLFANGKSLMFDLRGCGKSSETEFLLNNDISPLNVIFMNPKGKDYIISRDGKFSGDMSLLKSLQVTLTLNGTQATPPHHFPSSLHYAEQVCGGQ